MGRFDFDPSKKVRAYSKGNRQKLSLIAALMTRADLLVLDEPTSGLDPLMEQAFRECIREAIHAGQTVFLSSHMEVLDHSLQCAVAGSIEPLMDNEVTEQSVVAWVAGPSGTEVVTAPFAGSVTNVLVHEGDTVLPGTVIAVVADTRSLQVETVDVNEYVISQVHVGLPVRVTVDAVGSSTLAGIVSGVALLPQASSSGDQTYPVIIR